MGGVAILLMLVSPPQYHTSLLCDERSVRCLHPSAATDAVKRRRRACNSQQVLTAFGHNADALVSCLQVLCSGITTQTSWLSSAVLS